MKKSLLKIYFYSIFLFIFFGCKREEFDTSIIASMNSGIKKDLVMPCPIVIYKHSVKHSKVHKDYVTTIYTDSFGSINKHFDLTNPKNKEYYTAELLESLWQLPTDNEKVIKAGFENNLVFNVKPKWRHLVYLIDSSGIYQPCPFVCTNSLTKNYTIEKNYFKIFPKYGTEIMVISAPSFSHIFITLNLFDPVKERRITMNKVYNSETTGDIWIKF